MSSKPGPTLENERQFLFHQRKEVMRLAESPGDSGLRIAIVYESPRWQGQRKHFGGTPHEVLDQIDEHDRSVVRHIARQPAH